MGYRIRLFREGDTAALLRVMARAEGVSPSGMDAFRRFFSARLRRPRYDPAQDLFLAESEGELCAFLDLTMEVSIGRVVVSLWVGTEQRRQGIAGALYRGALPRMKETGAAAAQISIAVSNAVAGKVLEKWGFSPVRRYCEMELSLEEAGFKAGGCRALVPGEEGALAEFQNRAFAGSWGYHPNTADDIRYYFSLGKSGLGDVLIIEEAGRPAAYCWTGRSPREYDISNEVGRVFMIGVAPDCRGRGAGRQVLQAGLAHLKAGGYRLAELICDSENETALSLYRSLGFRVVSQTVWYQQSLVQ